MDDEFFDPNYELRNPFYVEIYECVSNVKNPVDIHSEVSSNKNLLHFRFRNFLIAKQCSSPGLNTKLE